MQQAINVNLMHDALVVGNHIVSRGFEPKPSPTARGGKWYWLRKAVWNSPTNEWMRYTCVNRKEAERAQSSINNKYLRDPLTKRGLKASTALRPVDGQDGEWYIYWKVYPIDSSNKE